MPKNMSGSGQMKWVDLMTELSSLCTSSNTTEALDVLVDQAWTFLSVDRDAKKSAVDFDESQCKRIQNYLSKTALLSNNNSNNNNNNNNSINNNNKNNKNNSRTRAVPWT